MTVPRILELPPKSYPMTFPLHDWQFWVATALALAAAWWLLKGVIPRKTRKTKGRKATLTIEGRPPSKG
jgi:hypothetical protein